ncbi:restriction endonuclease subunit S [Aneurinibacillus thermoaerophilus]|uniref:restriction endonuclease subunit S n=1 Tax=Aneurinibacillus thermoaerophilus TaxID=143495 RepID=UPI002E1D5AE1|nr:restriction endonuclease subunit S [Aneurinibacillus thermoaerophilus]MED0679087.1 restriction endonuclease subunit S [Aneurinibacillus thermoaerophilus]MED0736606.1 restriction endonuclease subunit S [Aneurinibacillus thermoaerophilus]MED0765332.1 restriction endonuclease subunit S [Aneurinibacillus thermoaerophilus]
MAYKFYKIKDIGEVVSGTTPNTNNESYWNGNIKWITPAELIDGHNWYLYNTTRKITEKALKDCNLRMLQRKTILLTSRAPIGKVAIVGEEMCTNQGFKSIICNPDYVNSEYLYFWLLSKKEYLNHLGRGATFKEISKSIVENIKVPLPSLETQKKTIEILKKSLYLIDKRKAQIEALDQLTQSVFLEMFGDPVQNSLGFKTEPLHELCVHIFGGGTPSKSNPEYYIGNIPWVTPKDMKDIVINDSIDHINEDAIANSSAKLIPPNSLLMVIRSGILKKKLPIAINTREVTVNQDMKAFVVDKNKITVEYLLYFFEFYQKVLLNRVRSVTADNLDFQQIKEILVPVPAINKQKEFSNIFYKVLAEKNKCLQQLNELENNFNSLMQRAFKGELFSD